MIGKQYTCVSTTNNNELVFVLKSASIKPHIDMEPFGSSELLGSAVGGVLPVSKMQGFNGFLSCLFEPSSE